MAKKWEGAVIENICDEGIDNVMVEKLVEEVAEFIYSEICQLSKIQFSDSFNEETNFYQRTGTDA